MRKNNSSSLISGLIKALQARRNYERLFPYRVDGRIVGNGSQDFTKDYRSYSFCLDGVPTQLIDCPGIEGDEEKFCRIIRSALLKCHLVCYVTREGKGVETTTLARVKEYLSENVEVLGVLNIPFNPEKEYDGADYDRDMQDRVRKEALNSANVEKALRSVLPENLYCATLSISALPGLCGASLRNGETTLADPDDESLDCSVRDAVKTLCRQQRNYLRHTTPENLLSSSRILILKNAILNCCKNAPSRMRKNFCLRLRQILKDVYIEPLQKSEKKLSDRKDKFSVRVKACERRVKEDKFRMSRNMLTAIENGISGFYRKEILTNIVYPHIERNVGIEKSDLVRELSSAEKRLTESLKVLIDTTVRQEANDFAKHIRKDQEQLIHGLELEVSSLRVEIPDIAEKLFSHSELKDWTINIGSYAFSGGSIGSIFGGPLGASIGAAIGSLVGALISWVKGFFSKKAKINNLKHRAEELFAAEARDMFGMVKPSIENYVTTLGGSVDALVSKARDEEKVAEREYLVMHETVESLMKIDRSIVALIEKSIT